MYFFSLLLPSQKQFKKERIYHPVMLGYVIWRNTNIHWRILAFRLQKIFQQFSTIWRNTYDNILCYFNQCMTIIFVQNKSKKEIRLFCGHTSFSQLLVLWSRTSMEHGFFMGFPWVFSSLFPKNTVWHIPSLSSSLAVHLLCLHFWLSFYNSSYHGFVQYSNTFHLQMLAKKLLK